MTWHHTARRRSTEGTPTATNRLTLAVWVLLALLVVALLGCGGAAEPDDGLPAVGRYSYTYTSGLEQYTGFLVLTVVTADAIDGEWEVTGYAPEIGLKSWNVDAYLAWADPDNGGNISQRIWRAGSATELGCSAIRIRPDGAGGVTTHAATCTLTWHGGS